MRCASCLRTSCPSVTTGSDCEVPHLGSMQYICQAELNCVTQTLAWPSNPGAFAKLGTGWKLFVYFMERTLFQLLADESWREKWMDSIANAFQHGAKHFAGRPAIDNRISAPWHRERFRSMISARPMDPPHAFGQSLVDALPSIIEALIAVGQSVNSSKSASETSPSTGSSRSAADADRSTPEASTRRSLRRRSSKRPLG